MPPLSISMWRQDVKQVTGLATKGQKQIVLGKGSKKKLEFSNSFGDPLVGLSNWLLFVPPVVGGKATFFWNIVLHSFKEIQSNASNAKSDSYSRVTLKWLKQ